MRQVAQHLRPGNREAIGNRVEDALIGLMQKQPVDALRANGTALKQALQNCGHFPDGKLVHLLTIHLDRAVTARSMPGISCQHFIAVESRKVQHSAARAIAAQQKSEQPVVIGGFDGNGSRSIAEQHTAAAVIPVHKTAQLVGADHQGPTHAACAQELRCRHQRKQKATAGGGEIKGHRVGGSKSGLHRRSGSEQIIRSGGGQQHQIEAFGGPAGHGQSRPSRVCREVAQALIRTAHPSCGDPCAALDPLVTGVHSQPQLVVADHLGCLSAAAADESDAPGVR